MLMRQCLNHSVIMKNTFSYKQNLSINSNAQKYLGTDQTKSEYTKFENKQANYTPD